MQKLQLSFKLLSQIPRKLATESPLCKNIIGSLVETNPSYLFNSSPLGFSQLGFGSSRCYHGFSGRISGFVANPVLLKQIVSKIHLKNQSRGFLDHMFLMNTQFRRRHFQIHKISGNRWRSWIPTTDDLLLGLVLANVAVFVLWRVADPAFMKKNFMISVENFTSGRVHTLITSAFSHIEIEHIFSNMIGLYFFGKSIGNCFGPQFLLNLYLAGALGGSIFYLVHHAFMSPTSKGSGMWYVDPNKIPALGASGAVNAVMLLHIFLFPKATIYYVFLPVPAMLLGAFLIGKDVLRMTEGDSQISGSAHLGGAFVAALAWARYKKRWI
ncbi:hypothetical protein AQUCO_00200859v1 [Aquilegia coerulea]|uniref:Peptidase S54 rhomboid domain-containing protein n=1 Tax=Aquilegia coerulea TaxID=218851 RepID=A0A2G5F519_AQUCA|nr:hypothetical protein AQUCO_00200859v1 [Aquilegia coerulea]